MRAAEPHELNQPGYASSPSPATWTANAEGADPDAPLGSALARRLREAGLFLLRCSAEGELERKQRGPAPVATEAQRDEQLGADVIDRLFSCDHFLQLLRDLVGGWNRAGGAELLLGEAMTGVWLGPLPIVGRPRKQRTGYLVVVFIADASLVSDATGDDPLASGGRLWLARPLLTWCRSAGLDPDRVAELFAKLPPAQPADLDRLWRLARALHEDERARVAADSALVSTSQQLAESYEEINLLYRVIQSMTAPGMQRPERFVRIVCEELRAILPYEWVAVQFRRGLSRQVGTVPGLPHALQGRLFVVEGRPTGPQVHTPTGLEVEPGVSGSTGQRVLVSSSSSSPLAEGAWLTTSLLEMASPEGPLVLEPGRNVSHARFSALGNTVLVHPILSGRPGAGAGGGSGAGAGDVVGVVLAGQRVGDPAASNIDLKLMGAIAGHMAIFLENAALYEDLSAMFLGTLEALTASIDAKDRYTCGHSQRVAQLTAQLAQVIGPPEFDEHIVKRMHIAGLVHDVGKIGVPEHVLLKPGRLTEEEFAWVKLHPEMGYRILKDIPQLADILPGVLHHHERWDGTGYPRGLSGEAIPLVARLIGLADAFDAMSSTRTYRAPMSRKRVLEEMRRCAGTQFDPALVKVFVELDFREYDRLVREHYAGGGSISPAA